MCFVGGVGLWSVFRDVKAVWESMLSLDWLGEEGVNVEMWCLYRGFGMVAFSGNVLNGSRELLACNGIGYTYLSILMMIFWFAL